VKLDIFAPCKIPKYTKRHFNYLKALLCNITSDKNQHIIIFSPLWWAFWKISFQYVFPKFDEDCCHRS